jgi:hypothetical protein
MVVIDSAPLPSSVTGLQLRRQVARASSSLPSDLEATAVILSVIPPRTTSKTGSDQADGTPDLCCENATGRNHMDGEEPTHNRLAMAAG